MFECVREEGARTRVENKTGRNRTKERKGKREIDKDAR